MYRKTMVDNIFKDSAFLAYMRMTDSIKKQNGGERIAMPLMYGDNKTVKTVGGYEVLDTTPQEGEDDALYKFSLIDLDTQTWATGGKQTKVVQPERLSERTRKGSDSLNFGIMLN